MDRAVVIHPVLPPNRRIIAVSDIHGNLPFFLSLMEKIRLTPEDILVLDGDMLEKGRDSLALLRRLMALARTHTLYPLCGNCDGLVLRFFETDALDRRFFSVYLPQHPWPGRAASSSWRTCPACAGTCGRPTRRSGPGCAACPPFWRPSIWSLSTGASLRWTIWISWSGGAA